MSAQFLGPRAAVSFQRRVPADGVVGTAPSAFSSAEVVLMVVPVLLFTVCMGLLTVGVAVLA